MRRVIGLLVVVSVAGLGTACSGTAASSSADPSDAPTVSCRAISGTDDFGQRLTLSGCTGATGGSGTVMGPFVSPTQIHWSSGGVTRVMFEPTVQVTAVPTCNRVMTVTDGTVISSTVPGISGQFQVAFCIDASGSISLAPGTSLRV